MGQTASTIDESNPQPAEFTFEKAAELEVDIDKVNGVHEHDVTASVDVPENVEADDRDDAPGASEKRPSKETQRVKSRPKKVKPKKSKEDEIDQEHAKQDLLAYLEIVGENASNLPLTWRDDPQLGRTVSTLTSKEYAKKADAFIPCDIRIIGATSANYDRTADLPINNRMQIGEKATEPGLSLGGPICNSLLKALYDHENSDIVEDSIVDAYDFAVEDNMFDDDDASLGAESIGSFQFEETLAGAALSWSTLLRKMKDEMEDQGHPQVPILTSSRRFDLDEAVHLLPGNFNPKLNRKFALLVGCNYTRKSGELQNSHNDIEVMKDYIVNVHGFPESNDYMTVLMDDGGGHEKPTHRNIIHALKSIALRSRPGDAVFIQFAGHGGRISDLSAETDCYDEVFAPVDFQKKGLISEKTIFRSLLVSMAEDVTVTMLLDSCDTGIVFDMPFSWETRNDNGETLAKLSLNDNFSFVRFLSVVKQMYDSSITGEGDELDSDDEEFNRKKNSLISALGDTLKGVAYEAEIEVQNFTKKTTKIVKKMIKVAKEIDDDSFGDDRSGDDGSYHDDHVAARSASFDDGNYDYSDDDSGDEFSDDDYEGRIRRNYS